MKLRLVIAEAARADLQTIKSYGIREWGSTRADRYLRSIRDTLELLRQHPESGRPRPEISPSYRARLAGRHVIFYRIEVTDLIVLRILHQRMDVSLHL